MVRFSIMSNYFDELTQQIQTLLEAFEVAKGNLDTLMLLVHAEL